VKRFFALVATGAVLAALVGAAHSDAGKPLLRLLQRSGGCPVSLDAADAASVEAYRVDRLRRRAGVRAAKSHPAWHFELGRARRAQVSAWAAQNGIGCERARGDSVLRCDGVRSGESAGVTSVYFQFDRDRLVAVDVWRGAKTAAEAVAHVEDLGASLARRVGPPTHRRGRLRADYLEDARFRRAAFEYRYREYLAKLSVTNFGGRGIKVREQYQWAPASEPL